MQIHVPIPREGVFPVPGSWEDANEIIKAQLPAVTELAGKAYVHDNDQAWAAIQQLLYHWNLDELERKSPVTDYGRAVRQALRNRILEVEARVRKQHTRLQCWDDFTPERAIEELHAAATTHRIHDHPLLAALGNSPLSNDSVRLFLENY